MNRLISASVLSIALVGIVPMSASAVDGIAPFESNCIAPLPCNEPAPEPVPNCGAVPYPCEPVPCITYSVPTSVPNTDEVTALRAKVLKLQNRIKVLKNR